MGWRQSDGDIATIFAAPLTTMSDAVAVVELVRSLLADDNTEAEPSIGDRLRTSGISLPPADSVQVLPGQRLNSLARDAGKRLAQKLAGGRIRETAALSADGDFRSFITLRLRLREAATVRDRMPLLS